MAVTDFRGNQYDVGDTVLYPRMSGRSCEMQEATVVEIKTFDDERWVRNPNYDPNAPFDRVNNPRQIREGFENFKVKVKPTRSSRDFYRTGAREDDIKPVWIHIGENVVKA